MIVNVGSEISKSPWRPVITREEIMSEIPRSRRLSKETIENIMDELMAIDAEYGNWIISSVHRHDPDKASKRLKYLLNIKSIYKKKDLKDKEI